MTTAGTTGIVIRDMTADGVENDAVRNFSPGPRSSAAASTAA